MNFNSAQVNSNGPIAVKNARPYQVELLEKAKKKNAIVFLGTGSGKTFIATMMIKEFMPSILSEGKKTVFLVNSVPLVDQQAKFIRSNTPLTVQSFCGADNVDFWTKTEWANAIRDVDVLVMVHQVFLDALTKAVMSLRMVNLLIIDECHHTIGNSPYSQIFKRFYHPFKEECPDEVPHVLALTASVVTSKVNLESFKKKKRELEAVLDSEIITVKDLPNLLLFVTQPDEIVRTFSSNPLPDELNETFELCAARLEVYCEQYIEEQCGALREKVAQNQIILDAKNTLRKFKKYLSQLKESIISLGLYSGAKLVTETQNVLETEKLMIKDDFGLELWTELSNSLEAVRMTIDEVMEPFTDSQRLDKFVSEKARTLIRIIKDTVCGLHGKLTIIVFVQQRVIAPCVAALLTRFANEDEGLGFLKVGYAVGCGVKSAYSNPSIRMYVNEIVEDDVAVTAARLQIEAILKNERKKLETTLEKFRTGTLNCVVSTAVLEEGMDIQSCNLVVRFDRIPEVRSYIQSKGRARAKPSKFYSMVPMEDQAKIARDIGQFKAIENLSIKACHDITDLDDSNDDDDDDDDEEEDEYDEFFADPTDKQNSPRITTNTATAILNRYIQGLPTDRFTRLRPYFEYCTTESAINDRGRLLFQGLNLSTEKFHCRLYMPHLTPYAARPFVGKSCATKKAAKRFVALDACKRLHRDGLLNEMLIPKRKKDFILVEDDELNEKRGTKASKEFYEKKLADELKISEGGNFLYRVTTQLDEEAVNLKNAPFRHQDHEDKMGLIVGSKLPDVCTQPFKLYTISGMISVRLDLIRPINLGPDDLDLVAGFHEVAFDVLGCKTSWMMRKIGSRDPMIVPLTGDLINDELMRELKIEGSKKRTKMADEYKNTVITPNHRPGEHYFVEEVMNTTPTALLNDNQVMTYAEYYKTKHGMNVTNFHQNLLRVSGADKRQHMFSPVALNQSKKSTDRDQIFIPELCHRHVIKASLWKEIQLIPFVIERASMTLKLGNLSTIIARESGLHFNHGAETWGRLLDPDFFDRIPSATDLLESFTLTSASEEFNLERLEVLGDVFLKYSVSLNLFTNSEAKIMASEGILSSLRSRVVGNKRLFKVATAKGFEKIVSATKFEPYLNFMPLGFTQNDVEKKLCEVHHRFVNDDPKSRTLMELLTISELEEVIESGFKDEEIFKAVQLAHERHNTQGDFTIGKKERFRLREHVQIADKSLADVVEALIGTYLKYCGQEGALKVMKWLGLDASVEVSKLPSNSYAFDEDKDDKENRFFKNQMELLLKKINSSKLEEIIGYEFKEKSFLVQSMTHPSYMGNRITDSYERLEFLGDAVLDYVITCHLYSHPGNFNPGEITNLRSALVCNNSFASLILRNEIDKHLLSTSNELFNKINEYKNSHYQLEMVEPLTRDEANRGAHILKENLKLLNEQECYELQDVEVPKVLGDILESLIGAIFLDSKMDLKLIWRIFSQKLCPFIEEVIALKPRNPITELYELFPEKLFFGSAQVTNERVVIVLGVLFDDGNTLKFRGIGKNKKQAKVAAAKCALKELRRASKNVIY